MLGNLSEAEKQLFAKKKPLPSLQELRLLFLYLPETGELVYLTDSFKSKYNTDKKLGHSIGDVARDMVCGRKVVSVGSTYFYAHRVIWKLCHGVDPIGDIDHRDRDKRNDRIENLRDVSRSQNNHNASIRKDNTTGHKGVLIHTHTRKYFARLRVRGRTIYGPRTSDLNQAIADIVALRLKYLGEDYVQA